jgi:tRNA nucleotidyltransferase (CCA-adding enzyme)
MGGRRQKNMPYIGTLLSMRLEQEICHRIRPSAVMEKEVRTATDRLVNAVRETTSGIDGVVDVKVVGSVAKGTFLSRPDIDVFIIFDESVPRPNMDRTGLEIGRKLLVEREERYAEHPYVHGFFEGFEADIVPCYGIKDPSKLVSAVDRTPFHTDYMLAHLKQGQRDEVRVLKQFMKGIGTYGAEAKVQGFSGYLAELLILRYGDFRSVLERASNWKYGIKLELEGKGKTKFDTPLVFYDPVDNNRNVASALSLDRFSIFIHACKEYLARPDERFFFPVVRGPLDSKDISRLLDDLGMNVVTVRAERTEIIDDNLYPQARKTQEGLAALLQHEGFAILDKAMLVDRTYVYMAYLLESDGLSPGKKHLGPPIWMENAQEFLKRWRTEAIAQPYIEDGRWVALVPRRSIHAKSAINDGIVTAAMGSAFKNVKIEVFDHGETTKEGFEAVLSVMLDKRMPWEV